MAKSKARFLSELLGSTGLVKKSKSALAGADEVLDLDVIPSIPNSKLTNSNISIAGHSTALGASVTLNTGDIGEHTNYKYYTDARVRSAVSVSGDLAYNSSTGVFSFTERTDAEVRGLVSATGSLSYNSSTGVMSFTMPAQNTSNITEGSNLYFTNARADARITNAGSGNWNTAYGWGNHASGGYAPLASPTLTGTPAAPTAAGSTSTTQLATTAFVQQEITTLIGGAPSTLNDLNELAAAINDDANYNSTLTTALATKLPKSGGTMTGGLAGTTASFSGAITAPSIRASSGAFYINRGSDGTQAIRVDADGVVVIPTNYFYVSASQGSYFSSAVRFRGTISNDTGTNVTFGQPISVSGNIVVSGTVDGRDVATDGAKLDGIAASANNYSLPFTNNSSNWNTAYGWGNHASGGYAPASTTITTSATQGSALYIRNSSPTIYLRDTDHLSSMIHQNSNVFYVLRSNSNDATGWTAHDGTSGTVSGQWPLSINITNASNSFSIGSPNVSAAGHTVFHAGNSTQFTSAMNTKLSGIATSANNYSLPSTVLHSNAYKMTGSGFKLGFHSGGGGGTFGANHYSMGKDNANGSWSSPHYSDLIIGYHTGIRIGAAYTGIRFYNNSPTSDTNNTGNGNGSETLLMTIGGHAGGTGVVVHNNLTVNDNLYLGDGNDGYFYSDSNGRTAFANGDFYIQSSVGNYYNYATNQYIGDSSGDNIYFRGNTMSGNAWTLTGAGTLNVSNAYSTEFYSSSWFRNSVSGTGLYNSATGQHFYSDDDDYWNIGGGTSANGLRFRDEHNGTIRGYVYADNGNNIGFLDESGGWALRVVSGNYTTSIGSFRAPIFYDSDNTGYYFDGASSSTSVRINGDVLCDGQYGKGMVGVYSSTVLQHVWSMGAAYRLAANGSTAGNLYGMAWSHPNAGTKGGANHLNDHGLLIINNGGFKAAISSRAVFSADVRGTQFYDYNNTAYYVDPASTSTSFKGQGVTDSKAGFKSTSNPWSTSDSAFFPNGITTANTTNWIYGHCYLGNAPSNGNGNEATAAGTIESTSWHKASLYYDRDNTAYYGDFANTGTSLKAAGTVETPKLYLNGGNYEGSIVFGATDSWRTGIRQHDDADAELRIWAKNSNGRIHIATGYDGQPASISRPTDGFVVDHNNVGIGPGFQSLDPSEKLHVIGNMKLTGSLIGNANSASLKANTTTSYGTWLSGGSRGGYDGIVFDGGGDTALMFDGAGNGGMYRQSGGGWYNYFHVGNNCMGINESTTSSSYGAYLTGAFYATGNITAYSDRRVKENIVQIDDALEKVNKLEGVYYNRIDDESKTKEIGFIAQDVNEVVPELVTYAEDVDQYGVKYQNTTALLVEAVKELTQQVNDLKQEIKEIKEKK